MPRPYLFLRTGLPATLPFLLARGRFRRLVRAGLCAAFVGLYAIRGLRLLGDLLALLADDRNRLADLDLLPFRRQDLQYDSADVGLDLLRHLLRVELVQRLALLDLLALRLEPLDDRARFHALAETGQRDLARHLPAPHGVLDRSQNVLLVRHDELFHDGREGKGSELRANT